MSIAQSGDIEKVGRLDEAERPAGATIDETTQPAGATIEEAKQQAEAIGAAGDGSGEQPPVHIARYLPLALLTTASIVGVPVLLVAAFVPHGGVLSMAVSAVAGIAVSLAIAGVEASIWARLPRSRDLLFADLTLWGWLRRCWAERSLAATRRLYASGGLESEPVSIELLERLSKLLEARDSYTHGHSQRVARHAARIAKAMYLSPAEIAKVRTAAMVHDVGKLYTPRRILNNPSRLTDEEFAVIKRHPGDGADMLAAIGDLELAAMVRHHHERIDGRGYPDSLNGLSIPLGARIIAVADTFDAITSSRAYRAAGTHRQALETLSRESGSQLDAAAVTAFLSCYSARRSVAWLSFATVVPQRIVAGLQSASASLGAGAAGVSSILPAVGAAGLLALSSGWKQDRPAASASGSPPTALARTTQQAARSTATLTTGSTSQPSDRQKRSTKHAKRRHLRRVAHTSPNAKTLGGAKTLGAGEVEVESPGAPTTSFSSESTTTQSSSPGSSAPSAPSSPPANRAKEGPGSVVEEATAPVAEAKPPHVTVSGVVGTVTETLADTGETLSKTTETLTGTVNETLSKTGETLSKTTESLNETTESLTGAVNETLSKTKETLSKVTESLGETLSNLP